MIEVQTLWCAAKDIFQDFKIGSKVCKTRNDAKMRCQLEIWKIDDNFSPPFLGSLLKLSQEELCHFNHKSVKYVYVKGSPPKRKHQKSAKITVQNVLQSIFLHCWEQFDDMCGPWEIRADNPRCTHQVHDCRRVTLYTEPGMDKFSRE